MVVTLVAVTLSGDEERDVIERVRAGHVDEFRILVLAHQSRIYAVIVRSLGDEGVAQELTQDVFVRAYRALPSFRFESRFSTWLTRIALNVTSSYCDSKWHRRSRCTVSLDTVSPESLPQGGFTAAGDGFDSFAAKRLAWITTQLPPRLREVFVLCALEQRAYAEVAEILNVPVGTVRSRLNRARLEAQRLYFDEER